MYFSTRKIVFLPAVAKLQQAIEYRFAKGLTMTIYRHSYKQKSLSTRFVALSIQLLLMLLCRMRHGVGHRIYVGMLLQLDGGHNVTKIALNCYFVTTLQHCEQATTHSKTSFFLFYLQLHAKLILGPYWVSERFCFHVSPSTLKRVANSALHYFWHHFLCQTNSTAIEF